MAMTNNKVYNAYSTKKKNALAPYLEAGNGSVSGGMSLPNTQPTGGNTRVYNAYGGLTQPKATTKVASAYSTASSPADTAYRSASSPAAPSAANTYQPGEILRKNAEKSGSVSAQPQSALTGAAPAGSALSAYMTGTGNKSNANAAVSDTPNTPLYSAYNGQAALPASSPAGVQNTPQEAAETPVQSAVYKAYGTQNGQQGGAYSAQRQSALRQAETNYNKLLNYLPEYNELMGMRGLGVANQSLMNAYGKYQQNVADINSQYDELEREYALQQDALAKEELETQIGKTQTAYADLNDYITSAGDNFTQEGYDRFKQGLLQAGYTQQEIDAAENMLPQSTWDVISKAKETATYSNNAVPLPQEIRREYKIIGDGILAGTAKEIDFGSFADTGKEGSGQYQYVQDILNFARAGRIPDGTIINFNYGKGSNALFMYYGGYFYPVSGKINSISNYDIVARGKGSGFKDLNDL